MDNQKRTICRLCLKICDSTGDSFKRLEGDMADVLDVLLPKIDLAVVQEPVMCTNCATELINCFNFKADCFYTHDYIFPLVDNKNAVKLDLRDVYMSKHENNAIVPQDHGICGFCMNPTKNCFAVSLDVKKGNVLEDMIEQCLPELNFDVIKKPIICASCYGSLGNCFRFVRNCLTVEQKIKEYCETLDLRRKGQIELSSLLQFTMNDIKSEIDSNSVNVSMVERQFCEDSENAKEKADRRNEYLIDTNDPKFSSQKQLSSKNMTFCKEEVSKPDVNKDNEIFYTENEPDLSEEQKFLGNEEIHIKTDERDFNRFKDDIVLTHSNVATNLCKWRCLTSSLEGDPSCVTHTSTNKNTTKITTYLCNYCSFQTKHKHNIKRHFLLMHEDPSVVRMYKCDFCEFETKLKSHLKTHLQVHNEKVTYKCNLCSYQTKLKSYFKAHLLVHKDPSEITMYKCNSCSYQTKQRGGLKRHVLMLHKSPSEVTVYNCEMCSFWTKSESYLKKHLLIHKSPSELTMYNCDTCSYKTKHKNGLRNHSLLHKDSSEVTVYRCDSCSFQTKHKYNLKRHLLICNDSSELTMHKCDSCPYQTKQKSYLKRHLLVCKDSPEVTMYKCDSCPYQTKQKSYLKRHSQIHQSPSEVTLYNCDTCSYQTNQKHSLKIHSLLLHKAASDVTMYKCDICPYQARQKSALNKHQLLHKNPCEITMYDCGSCSFRTKRKSNLRNHLLLHKDLSEITMYKCDTCSFETKRKGSLKAHLLLHKAPTRNSVQI